MDFGLRVYAIEGSHLLALRRAQGRPAVSPRTASDPTFQRPGYCTMGQGI